MLQAYSTNLTLTALTPVPFNNVAIQKGCTSTMQGTSTIELNRAGIYMVSVDGDSTASNTLQLYKDGVAMPQAQSTGISQSFTALVQVDRNNTGCCCSSPVTLQVLPTLAGTDANVNIVVTKLC